MQNDDELRKVLQLLMSQKGGVDDGMKARLMEINAMPKPERSEALRMLGQDYAGKRDVLNKSMDFNESQLQAPMPKGGVAGPSSNPFAIYVGASPVEMAVAGAGKYLSGKERKADRASLGTLSDEYGGQNMALMAAQANTLKSGGMPQQSEDSQMPGESIEEWMRRTGRT